MASSTPPLAERQDIHKSCKSLETLLGVFNDYCEAAGAVTLLQKKLAKALRETAGMKVTGEVPANAMNISASIFETSSDIDSKFTKFVDKEYDGISAEVRKWFKKLTKEEKAHDDKIANVNARIKQAGLIYEKKSKKNARDAGEEHFRYINLVSTLGPEASQERHNHALQVTQRHTLTTYSVAACLSRVADAEWLRTYDGVRRFAPAIGQLGEWRALCEGGWTAAIPGGLADVDESDERLRNETAPNLNQLANDERFPNRQQDTNHTANVREMTYQNVGANPSAGYPLNGEREREYPPSTVGTSSGQQLSQPQQLHYAPSTNQTQNYSSPSSGPPSLQEPHHETYDNGRDSPPGASATLASFPNPPTHIPVPFPSSHPSSLSQQHPPQPQTPKARTASPPRLADSPISNDLYGAKPGTEFHDSPTSLLSSDQFPESSYAESNNTSIRNPERSPPQDKGLSPHITSGTYRQGESPTEFGVATNNNGGYGRGVSRSVGVQEKSPGVNRTDTAGSSGSIVAAMRQRYSSQAGTTSPGPKDVPHLPLSVTDLANRYRPLDDQTPPRQGTVSPTSQRQLPRPPSESPTQQNEHSFPARARSANVGSTKEGDDLHRLRRQRIDDLAEMELRDKELELRAREREIEMRARELDREREQLMNARGVESISRSQGETTSRMPPSPSPQQRSHLEFPAHPTSHSQPRSSPHLVPPPASQLHPQEPHSLRHRQSSLSLASTQPRSQPPSPRRQSPDTGEHAPYCGCDKCSIAKYNVRNTSPSPHDLRPPEKPINLRPPQDKPRSWMRRLSMPAVGHAFSLDSRKSSPTLRNVLEDGRLDRKSYETGGTSNRSMTNLGR